MSTEVEMKPAETTAETTVFALGVESLYEQTGAILRFD